METESLEDLQLQLRNIQGYDNASRKKRKELEEKINIARQVKRAKIEQEAIERQNQRKQERVESQKRIDDTVTSVKQALGALEQSEESNKNITTAVGEANLQAHEDWLNNVVVPTRDVLSTAVDATAIAFPEIKALQLGSYLMDTYGAFMDVQEEEYNQAAMSTLGVTLGGIGQLASEDSKITVPLYRGRKLTIPTKITNKVAGQGLKTSSDLTGVYKQGLVVPLITK